MWLISPFTSTTTVLERLTSDFLKQTENPKEHLVNVLLFIRLFVKIISWRYVSRAASCASKSVCLPAHVPPNCFSNSKQDFVATLAQNITEVPATDICWKQAERFDIMSGWLSRSRQSCLESPVVLFNIRVKTLAGHEDTLRGSLSDHSAECFLLWSSQSLDAAIYPSNLHSRLGQTEPGAFSDLSSARWLRCLHPRLTRSLGFFSPFFFF